MKVRLLSQLVVCGLVICLSGCTSETSQDSGPVFRKVAPEQSGVDFENRVTADLASKANLFNFDYFYNGAGVGVGDINNDGLQDIFFCGNQVPNRLYLNKGNLQFEDITEKAGINTPNKRWSNGVTFADINNDGWLDIYVSQGGPYDPIARENLLFLNNGDLTFSEKGKELGLADNAISNQAAFFDYDKDGDLDCVVMNENPLYGVEPQLFRKLILNNKDLRHPSSSHFYKNENGVFTDITLTSGIFKPTFGLGLAVSDINNDGWLDIYIANDYYLPDNLFINNGQGLFIDQIDQYTNQISFFGMGVDVADINNDLLNDIFVLDMASSDHKRSKTLMASMDVEGFSLLESYGFHTQYMFNSLQLNQGNNKFKNIAHFGKMAKTDWSWSVLMNDLDNNETNDVFVTNGYRRYALDNDFKNRVSATQAKYKGNVPLDVKKKLYYSMQSEKLPNLMYQNNGDLDFGEVANDWGLGDPSFSNGASYADLDNDGDLDLVINNMDEPAFLYENTTNNSANNYLRVAANGELSESFARVTISYDGKKQFKEIGRVRGYLSTSENLAHFGVGGSEKIDTVQITWLSGKTEERYNINANSLISFDEAGASKTSQAGYRENSVTRKIDPENLGLTYQHSENDFNDFAKEVLLPYKQSTLGPVLSSSDVNKDGNQDLFIGSPQGQLSTLRIQTDGGFEDITFPDFSETRDAEDMGAVFLDFDNDGDKDIYILTGGNASEKGSENYVDRFYLNQGSNKFSRAFKSTFDKYRFSGKAGCAIDFDNDGFEDLLVANRIIPQSYPIAAPSFLFKNEAGESFSEVTLDIFPDLSSFGIINDVIPTDFNQDGWMDIILLGEWSSVGVFQNVNGKFESVSEKSGLNELMGWWFSVEETDMNKDGLPDYILGNVGKNTKFTATKEKPFKIFANDFDSTGTLDVVLSTVYNNQYVPVRGKECSTDQMPFISEKFQTYDEYADASINDIFGEQLDSAYQKEANSFSSVLLINKGDGVFETKKLPVMAQLFPVLDVISEDFNGDGFDDVLLAGNIYDTEVETPRWDASSGLILYSNQRDGYEESLSLNLEGDIKSIAYLEVNGEKLLISGKNNDMLSVIKITQ